jgi:uncharacterized protein (DUF2062 family)
MRAVVAEPPHPPRSFGERLAAAGLAAVIVLGSASMWLGIPLGGVWLAARLTSDGVTMVLFALLVVPVTMVGFGWALYRVGATYEQLRGHAHSPPSPPSWRTSLSEERGSSRRARASRPLVDVAMTVSAIAALVVMAVWFFGFAEMRLAPLP